MQQEFSLAARILSVPCGAFLLGACASTFSPEPMVTVSSSGEVMRGSVVADIDKTGSFLIAPEDESVMCRGETAYVATDASTGQGVNTGNMSCTDGTTYDVPVYRSTWGSFDGAFADCFGDEFIAVGWGAQADVAQLRELLDRRMSEGCYAQYQ